MRERPIIMSAESVRAILAGRKTQTRRVCKPQPLYDVIPCPHKENWYVLDGTGGSMIYLIPPYKVDDRLLVKEKYGYDNEGELVFPSDLENDSVKEWTRLKLWKNPMFMPKRFSRITLAVTDVRLEKLQNMTIDDAVAEGFGTLQEYQETWDKLNAKRGFPWKSNPWVWVIEFNRIEK